MKRLICLLTVLFLPLTALAETIPAHVSSASRISVTIDAEVVAPEAEAIPRYQATLREFTEEEVRAMAAVLFGDRPYTGDSGYQDELSHTDRLIGRAMRFETVAQVQTGDPWGSVRPAYSLFAYTQYPFRNSLIDRIYVEFQQEVPAGEGCFSVYDDGIDPIPAEGLTGCQISLEDARSLADAAVGKFAPWMTLASVGTTWAMIDASDGWIPDHQGWAFVYTRDLPLPMTYEPNDLYNSHGLVISPEYIKLVVDDDGIQGMRYEHPLEIMQVLQENCRLLPFDEIMYAAEPHLYYTWETSDYPEMHASIDKIMLGYMVTYDLEIIPVWDFFGTLDMRAGENCGNPLGDQRFYQSLLTISALDGAEIDRLYGGL